MATKRRKIGARRLRHAAEMPAGVAWFLEHGRRLGIAEAWALGLGDSAAWAASNLAFDRPVVSGWTRAALREMGFGAAIDQHVEAGRCRPDRR